MSVANPNVVLVPVDFSSASFEAVGTALELVDSPQKVRVIYVVPAQQSELDYIREALDAAGGVSRARVELEQHLEKCNYNQVEIIVEEGAPSDVIAAKAEELNADLIVIPSHSRSGLPRLFLGSVASQVLRQAHCPVLVLRRGQ